MWFFVCLAMPSTPTVPIRREFFLGHTRAFAKDSRGFIKACMETGHPVQYAKIAFRDFYILTSPDAIRHVLQKNNKNYVKSFIYEGMKMVLGNGLVTSDGPVWLKHRRLIQPAFHRQVLQSLTDSMAETSNIWMDSIPKSGASWVVQTMELARETLVRALFGKSVFQWKEMEQMENFLLELRIFGNAKLKNPFMPPLWVPTQANKRFKEANGKLKALVQKLLDHKDSPENEGNILDLMCGIPEGSSEPPLTDAELYDEIVTLFSAGQETSAQALVFTMNELFRHPEALARLKAEVAALPDQFWRDPAFFRADSWLNACIKESLRLLPPVWAISRRALEDDDVSGYKIPGGSTIFLSIFALHRHPDFWESPDAFKPERFLGQNHDPKCFIPFGIGPRQCIGDQFAMMSMAISLALFYRKYEISFDAPYPLPVITPLILSPAKPVPYRISPLA